MQIFKNKATKHTKWHKGNLLLRELLCSLWLSGEKTGILIRGGSKKTAKLKEQNTVILRTGATTISS
jgi:hypothetical protein